MLVNAATIPLEFCALSDCVGQVADERKIELGILGSVNALECTSIY